MSKPKKLNVTQKAQHRVVATLSWDPKTLTKRDMASLLVSGIKEAASGDFVLIRANLARITGKRDETDRELKDPDYHIDLYCYAYDEDGEFTALVDPSAWNAIDENEKFYHSGENISGFGDHDDEQVFVELKGAQDHYHHFFFVAQGDEEYAFQKVGKARLRLMDSMSGETFIEDNIEDDTGDNKHAYLLCHIFTDGDDWYYTHIGEFCDRQEDWAEYLKQYILASPED